MTDNAQKRAREVAIALAKVFSSLPSAKANASKGMPFIDPKSLAAIAEVNRRNSNG